MDLPNQYVQNMQKLLGDEYPDFAASFSCDPAYGLRVNELKTDKDSISDYVEIELEKIPFVENGFFYDHSEKISKSPFYRAGLFYLQESSAMLPADRLPISEGDVVLDLCAAPGGKSTAILSKLLGTGFLLANDLSFSRAQSLLKNLELFGGSNYFVSAEAPKKLASIYPEFFDKILVDAPCSGEGMFRKDPSLIKDWTNKGPDYYSPLQREILDNAVKMLKCGGMLMYSTCTFSTSEDELNIKYILEKYPELSLINIEKTDGMVPGFMGYKEAARVFPHKVRGEGHFLCLLAKSCKSKNSSALSVKRDEMITSEFNVNKCNELIEFVKKINLSPDNIYIIKNNAYYLPNLYSRIYDKSIRFLRTGLLLGELDNNMHFKPSTTLALSLRIHDFSNVLNLNRDDIRLEKYLRGETIFINEDDECLEKGFVLICVESFGLGFAKYTNNNTLKNLLTRGYINN